ncbi:MAG: hypothetical protein H6825_06225 [Planctomycetes bacterium]|nr:hypothetical protein [Planctomycetota bacterium]
MSGPREFAEPDAVLRWTVHPAARAPVRTGLLALFVLLAGPAAAVASGTWAVGLFAACALAIGLRAWFLPRRYELDADGARETGVLAAERRLSWSEVRRVSSSRFGIHLSPRHVDSRVLPDKGLFLRLAGVEREQVSAFVREHVAGAGS